METENYFQGTDPHTMAFVGLLLRKGYQDPFDLDLPGMPTFQGNLENCMHQLLHTVSLHPLQEVVFTLSTLAFHRSVVNYRKCILQVSYQRDAGYHITQFAIHSPALRQARITIIARNEDLPFLRHIREAPLPLLRWPIRVAAWLLPFTSKNFRL